jgi:arylsulfatase A-like enzyme
MGAHMLWQKMFFYDEVARVPFVASWPGEFAASVMDRKHLVSGLDVAPTLCELAGIDAPPDCRGRSLVPLLKNRPVQWRDFLVTEAATNGRMVRTADHKLIKYQGDATEQLFDMRSDRGEMHNLAGSSASVASDLRKLLSDWESRLQPGPAGRLPGSWAR